VARNLDVDILKIVLAGAMHRNALEQVDSIFPYAQEPNAKAKVLVK
jgi:hypothetical protein